MIAKYLKKGMSGVALASVIAFFSMQTQANEFNDSRKRALLINEKADLTAWADNMRKRGVSESTIQDYIQRKEYLASLSGEERLDNYLRRKKGEENTFDDFDFKYDVENTDIQYLEAKYGKEVADYAYREHLKAFQQVKEKLEKPKKGLFSWFSD